MNLDELKKQQYQAQKDKDTLKVSVMRYLISQIHNKEIELRAKQEELTGEHIAEIIGKQMKQREEAIDAYESAGRTEKAETEKKELVILKELKS